MPVTIVELAPCVECGAPAADVYPDVHEPSGWTTLCHRHSGCVQTGPVTHVRLRTLDARGWLEDEPTLTSVLVPTLLERAVAFLRRLVGR